MYNPQEQFAEFSKTNVAQATKFAALSLESAEKLVASGEADAVAFGKLFLANPDLPQRFALRAPLNEWKANLFYTGGADGYADYPSLA